jgi:endogenous inhibitor of DNA gyrase (YacG/DUF329 family)
MGKSSERMMKNKQWPVCISNCADCGVGTWAINEYYMVKDRIWKQAWAGRRKSYHGKVPGQEILCIGCLEKRIGRILRRADFISAPINDPEQCTLSQRLLDRLATLLSDSSTLH